MEIVWIPYIHTENIYNDKLHLLVQPTDQPTDQSWAQSLTDHIVIN